MTHKERILATLNRQPVDRLPVDLWHTPEVSAALRQHCQVSDDFEMWRALGLDKIVWAFIDCKKNEAGGDQSMWHAVLRKIHSGAHDAESGSAPLAGCNTLDSLDSYAGWPDADHFDYEGAAALAARASRDYAVIGPWVSCFEIYCQLRGVKQSMIDLAENPELAQAILDRVETIQSEMMKRFFARAGRNLDLVFVSDDIAGPKTLLMSAGMWRQYLQPRLKRWCDLIHGHGLKVFYHTDGAARPLLKPILDCGVDVLNPIEHACAGMGMAELKKEFGHRVVFHGGVDNQTVLPRGTVDDVRRETRECLATLGAGRSGYICCSCHKVQSGTPIENILAMIETVQQS